MDRQAFIERLRVWAARADGEVTHTHGADQAAWQGQAGVLYALASVVASSGVTDPLTLRRQIIADRQKTLAAWNAERAEARAAVFTGEAQGYELVLDLLKDVDAWDVPVAR